MDSNILIHTDIRFQQASKDGMVNTVIRNNYRDFCEQKEVFSVAQKTHAEAKRQHEKGDKTAFFTMNTARRTMNIAESKLTTLSREIGFAILNMRKSYKCIRRINYQPGA